MPDSPVRNDGDVGAVPAQPTPALVIPNSTPGSGYRYAVDITTGPSYWSVGELPSISVPVITAT